MTALKIISTILIFCFLTILTQVGGIIYLISLLTHTFIRQWAGNWAQKVLLQFVSFLTIYSLATFLIVPFIAKPFGRVPLPLSETNHLQPLNWLTCLLNRHYVRPELKQTAFVVAQQMNDQFPGTTINYLDANFPFLDQFPLLPHRSHNDGKKLDLSFCYRNAQTGESINNCPSFIGYGICEEPTAQEKNTAEYCSEKGFWQYNFLSKVVSQENKRNFTFDNERTRALVHLWAEQPAIGKIFIEPHLKTRLNLTSQKIRFHGCQAVRHDDHIHVQL